jgi:hypothetical protein
VAHYKKARERETKRSLGEGAQPRPPPALVWCSQTVPPQTCLCMAVPGGPKHMEIDPYSQQNTGGGILSVSSPIHVVSPIWWQLPQYLKYPKLHCLHFIVDFNE